MRKTVSDHTGPGHAYGNVGFHLDLEYFHHLTNSLNIYWVENIEFGQIICVRFLLTYRSIPDLRLYSPGTCLTGPWLVRGGRHYSQTVWRDPDNPGLTKRCDVEYMLELPEDDRLRLYQVWSLELTMPSSSKRSRPNNMG